MKVKWKVFDLVDIWGGDQSYQQKIAHIEGPDAEQYAQLIVDAVNRKESLESSRDSLKAALERVKFLVENGRSKIDILNEIEASHSKPDAGQS